MTKKAKIVSVGSGLPKKVLTNADLEKIVDTSDEWILERSGIRERRIVSDGETNTSLAALAVKKALKKGGLKADDLDLILYCTNSADRVMPSAGAILQHKLGITNRCPSFDITAACTGFLVGISVADNYIRSGMYKTILVVGAEVVSPFVDWQDRATCVLFGDGAGACILTATDANDKSGILSTHMHTDGSQHELLAIRAGGSEMPLAGVDYKQYERKDLFFDMKGREVFKYAVRALADVAKEACSQNDFKPTDIDWFVPHQANIRILDAVAEKLKIAPENVLINVDRFGNTNAATIPIVLDEADDQGKLKRGDLVLFDAFGAGFTYGSALLHW